MARSMPARVASLLVSNDEASRSKPNDPINIPSIPAASLTQPYNGLSLYSVTPTASAYLRPASGGVLAATTAEIASRQSKTNERGKRKFGTLEDISSPDFNCEPARP